MDGVLVSLTFKRLRTGIRGVQGFEAYIRMIGESHKKAFGEFSCDCQHREMQLRYFGARRSAIERLASKLMGISGPDDPTFCFLMASFPKSSKKERKDHRRAAQRERLRHPNYQPPLPIIVGYGDARLQGIKRLEPLSVEFMIVFNIRATI
ncbi:hypothetical protein BDB00DRAFT_782992 [Zychaea mexicana]|uniref:uncharacterized protein n=1 Tax=Zychaea mexicana TaxID=64656 RepID=UPI0022FDEB95|nr:uncharacterized protein BDB00DRAFT_782992 [Zychaea mexicana]KAI9499482.1 hypothetical protein BDB00DRAFT_782992 [Zychaea mexicana]